MTRRFGDDSLVIASHNRGKVAEIADLLTPLGIAIESAGDLGLPEPVEDGTTFAENAILKAEAAARATGRPALADDSGLAVSALGGAPGIYAARWAETPDGRNFDTAMARVQAELGDNADRTARFVCVLAMAWPDLSRSRRRLMRRRVFCSLECFTSRERSPLAVFVPPRAVRQP